MRILVVGAGGTGGYFGGRLLEAKQDVTFLVRPRRAAELAASGLQIESPEGSVTLLNPPTVLAEDLRLHFDLVVLSCKAYDLEGAIESFAPAVGPNTAILPLLNGMRHLDVLDARFGPARVLGGLCIISAALAPGGRILHLNNLHALAFGERDGSHSSRFQAITAAFSAANFISRPSNSILQEMWEKWVFIAACAGITCLMRATVGDIVEAGGADLATSLIAECAAIAAAQGYPPRLKSIQQSQAALTAAGSALTASMFRDLERRAPVEAAHMIGDLLRRGQEQGIATPLLRVAYTHLRAYELRTLRESLAG